tara:strand:+ start:55 stop:894 length:840 start_codon:yes stop_codon:yes gene_type:complete
MPYSTKTEKLRGDNHWSIGDIGESWVKFKLAQHKIDSVFIDRTYDLFAWKRGHRIEVKTSRIYNRKNRNTPHYYWNFKHWQTRKDAFDYAVLVGLDNKNNVSVYYVIPQKYIHIHATKLKPNKDGSAKLMIRQSSDGDFLLEGNSYDKFSPCRNLNFDIFEQDNKSAFTRKKNAIAKKLIEFNTLHKMNVLKTVRDAFNDDSIKFPTKALTTKFDCSNDIILKARKLLGIPPKGKVSYTCKKCGYTTHDKQNMRKHKNRKRPCTPNDWKKLKGKRKKKR